MKKLILVLTVVMFVSMSQRAQDTKKTEVEKHPRIENAIKQIQDAIDYLEKAPDNFGGNKAEAIADCKKAVASLNKALKYRAKEDNKDTDKKKGKK